MKKSIFSAFCLENWFKRDLIFGIPIIKLKNAFHKINQISFNTDEMLGVDVAEPVAAGYSRIYELNVKPGSPFNLFIVDVGAGSTDFALLTISKPINSYEINIFTAHQGGIGKGVSVWDNALRAEIFKKVRETFGVSEDQPNYQILKAKIDAQIRLLKESVLSSTNGYKIDISPVNTNPIDVYKEDVENSLPVKDALSAIKESFNDYIESILKVIDRKKFKPEHTEFIVTGGGSFIPSIVNCISDCVSNLGSGFSKKVINNYFPQAYSEIPNFINFYPMLAVSLGSTESSYPEEKVLPKISADPGEYSIGGYYQKGI